MRYPVCKAGTGGDKYPAFSQLGFNGCTLNSSSACHSTSHHRSVACQALTSLYTSRLEAINLRPIIVAMSESSVAHKNKYPAGVGSKFAVDGGVLPFPGNTIIAHLSPSDPLCTSLMELHQKLSASPLSSIFTLLPPESWHMTIFEGVCDQVRYPGYWPNDLSMEAQLSECNNRFAKKLRSFELNDDETEFRLRIEGISPLKIGIGIHLEPETTPEDSKLRRIRGRLSELLQIRHPHHDHYELHLSLAYFIRHPTEEQEKELAHLLLGHLQYAPKRLVLGRPEFCIFENMFHFERQFYLGIPSV